MTDVDLRHDDLQRENVNLGLATLGTGLCVGASIGDAWLYVLYALAAAQVGTMLWWRHRA